MIKAAAIFVSANPAKPTASPSKPVSRSVEPTSSGETRRNDHLPEHEEWKDNGGLDRNEKPKRDIQNTSRQTQTSDPTASREEKTSEAQTNDTTDFQQLIAIATAELTGESPSETTARGDVLVDNAELTALQSITPVIVGTASGEGSSADMSATNSVLSAGPTEIPTPAVTPSVDAAVAGDTAQATPKSTIVSPDASVTLSDKKIELPPLPAEHTSGRPESAPIKANVPQAEIPRTNVEATASSTVAKTAASEINPNSGDSGTMTPGRPVVPFSSTDSPKSDTPASNAQTTIKPDVFATDQKQADAQSSSSGSSDQAPAKNPFPDGKTQAFEPSAFRQSFQAVSNSTPDVLEKVAGVVDSSTAHSRASQIEMMGQWFNTAPTTSTSSDDVAAMSAIRGAKLTEQITTHIQMRRDDLGEEMVVRLDPPELGKVHIQFRSEHGELTGVIRADNPQTLAELQREASSLMQRLNEAGVQIKTLDVQMNDLNQQGRGEQSFAQAQNAYSMFQQHNGDGRGYGYSHTDPTDPNNLIQDDPDAWNSQAGQYVSDSALNVML